jgi:hypothetical protein
LTLTLLAGLVCFIGYVAISLYFSDGASIPYSDHLSMPLALCFCGMVVVLQYAARRVWVSRLLLIALPILLVLSGMAVSESTVMRRDYPRASAGQEAPVQLALLRDTPHRATAYLIRAKQVQVSIPLQVSGVAEGYALISGPFKVTVDAANGSPWSSSWQGLNGRYLPGTSESWISIQMSRAFFDQVRSTPRHASFHSRAHAGAGRQCEEHSTTNGGLFGARFRHLLAPDRLVPSAIFRNRLQVCPAPTETYVYQRALAGQSLLSIAA